MIAVLSYGYPTAILGALLMAVTLGIYEVRRPAALLLLNWLGAMAILAAGDDPAPWLAFAALDAATAAALLLRWSPGDGRVIVAPCSWAAVIIAGLLLGQLLVHGAYGWAGQSGHPVRYLATINTGGWMQVAALLAGGACDGWRKTRWRAGNPAGGVGAGPGATGGHRKGRGP